MKTLARKIQTTVIWRSFGTGCLVLALQLLTIAALPVVRDEAVTDDEVSAAVERGLLYDSSVHANDIDVKTIGGIVTLSGKASSILSKERAPMIAEAVKGVRAVVNAIEVTPIARTDEEIRMDVTNALLADPATDEYDIKTTVKEGVVTLSGKAESWQEKELSTAVAKGVKGVKDVRNEVNVVFRTQRPDTEIAEDVKAALKNDVWVDELLIDVKVLDGKVFLAGTVGNAAEKARAIADAHVAGVKAVDDIALKVEPWLKDPMKRSAKVTIKPDAEIERAVMDAFMLDPRVSSFQLDVSVNRGAVTLRGVVDNLKAKNAAEQDAKNTVGVSNVINLLKVRSEAPLPDDKLVQNVKEALDRDPYLARYQPLIEVTARGGVVYLTGAVDSTYEKTHAEDVASRVKGVISINNSLIVSFPHQSYFNWPYSRHFYEPHLYNRPQTSAKGPQPNDAKVKDDIERELLWSPLVDAKQVKVSVEDGVATLTGTVDSWREFNAAVENAYEGGAKRVISKLKVR